MKKILCLLALSLFALNAFADNFHYAMIVDAGSTGSRLHLYRYNEDKNMPVIEDIFYEKNALPLARFAEQPDQAIESLKPILENTVKKIKDMNIPTPIPISVLGTAEMQLLTPARQKEIYSQLKTSIQQRYQTTFIPVTFETVSGKMKGIFGWLDINYLLKNFQQNRATVGTISIGGGSTEIAFATEKSTKPIDEITITINRHQYIIYSKTFLGLGLNETTKNMNADQDAEKCYPKDYDHDGMQGDFNLSICSSIYQQIIANYHIEKISIPTHKVAKFIAFSGAYSVYHFFGADPNLPDQETLEQTIINPTCSNNWTTLKDAYPYEPIQYLANYCSNGVFITNLLYDGFKLQSPQLSIHSKINDQKIDWTLGAMLYSLIK